MHIERGKMKIFMKSALCLLVSVMPQYFVQVQEPEEPDMIEIAENEADRLQNLLGLDGGQLFYVDSTLKHDYMAMREEMKRLEAAKVSNTSMYISVQDKWMEAIDQSFVKIFNEEQWETYLKNGAAKQQKARAKRKAKAEAALEKLRGR